MFYAMFFYITVSVNAEVQLSLFLEIFMTYISNQALSLHFKILQT